MARLILHIGLHKTATTSVQDAFHANRAVLAGAGLIYPDLGRHSGHHGLLTDWLNLPAPYHLPGGGAAALQALAAAYRDSDVTLFLSSEEMSRAGGPGGRMDWAALRAIFAGWPVTVICVLRAQWQFLQSVYLELARSRVPPPPPELLRAALEEGQIDGLHCDYPRLYQELRRDFAADEIRLLDFARLCAGPGGLLGGILAQTGCGLGAADLAPVGDGRANVSPRPLPCWAALAIAAGRPLTPALMAAVTAAFDLEYGADRPSCLFTRAELARLNDHVAPGNARLAPLMAGTVLGTAPPPDQTLFREDIGAGLWLRAARRIWLAGIG